MHSCPLLSLAKHTPKWEKSHAGKHAYVLGKELSSLALLYYQATDTTHTAQTHSSGTYTMVTQYTHTLMVVGLIVYTGDFLVAQQTLLNHFKHFLARRKILVKSS